MSEIDFSSGVTSKAISVKSESDVFTSKATVTIADSLPRQMEGEKPSQHLWGVFNCGRLVSGLD